MRKLCRNKGRTQQMFKSKSLGKEMKQNTIFSSHSNKPESDRETRVNFLAY